MWIVDTGATYLSSVRFSPDGRLLAAHAGHEGGWQFRNAQASDLGLVAWAGGFAVWYHSAGRSADGRWLAWRKRYTDDGGEHLFLIDLHDLVSRLPAEGNRKWPDDDPPDLPRLALKCATRGGP